MSITRLHFTLARLPSRLPSTALLSISYLLEGRPRPRSLSNNTGFKTKKRTIKLSTHKQAHHETHKTMQYQYPQASLPGLPVELRLIILQHALLLNSRIEIRHQQKCTSHPISAMIRRTLQATISPSSSSRTAWSLLQINSQIRTEALPLFFELCNFHFYDTLTRSLLASFLQMIGGDAVIGRMKHVSFHTRGKCMMFGLGDAEEEEGYALIFLFFLLSFRSFFCLLLIPLFLRVSDSKNNNITFLSLFPPPPLPKAKQKPKQKENSTNLPSPPCSSPPPTAHHHQPPTPTAGQPTPIPPTPKTTVSETSPSTFPTPLPPPPPHLHHPHNPTFSTTSSPPPASGPTTTR